MSLSVTSKQKMDGVYMLSPSGRLDTSTYPILEVRVDGVLQENPHTLVFDMERLDYISSMGVRVIARAQKAMKAHNGRVVPVEPPTPNSKSIRHYQSLAIPTGLFQHGGTGRLPGSDAAAGHRIL